MKLEEAGGDVAGMDDAGAARHPAGEARIGEARIGQAEAMAAERAFRERVSVLVVVFALMLALVHMGAAAARRESVLSAIEGSDTFAFMQSKMLRETVLVANANMPGLDRDVRASELAEAMRLRLPDRTGGGIGQLQRRAGELRERTRSAVLRGMGYELGEAALLLAIVLLSIALVARSRAIVWGASGLAAVGMGLAVLAAQGVTIA